MRSAAPGVARTHSSRPCSSSLGEFASCRLARPIAFANPKSNTLTDLNVVSNRRRRNPLLVQPYVESLASTIYQVVGGIAQVWLRRESISRSPDRLQ